MLPRERFSWIWLSALVVVFGAYFVTVAMQRSHPEPSILVRLGALAAALAVLGLVAGFTWLVDLRREKRTDPAASDERDRLIKWRSESRAYHVLMTGMILVGVVMPFGSSGWDIVNAALLAIAIAEIVHHGLIVLGYRWGWCV